MLSELRLLASREALLAVDTENIVAGVEGILQGDVGLIIFMLKEYSCVPY